MQITWMMVWGLFIAVFAVVVGVFLAWILNRRDELVSEKTLKLHLAPIKLSTNTILGKLDDIEDKHKTLECRVLRIERPE